MFLSRFFVYTSMREKKIRGQVVEIFSSLRTQRWPKRGHRSHVQVEIVYTCLQMYACEMTVINVCACVYTYIQAAVAAVNLSGGAWIEYVPWKLHDVGQRLLLADKKTEEGRTRRWGKKGQGVDDEVGVTSTSYFAHTVCRILGSKSLHDLRFPLCARSWRRNASFSEESHYRGGTLEPLSRTCVAKLI